MKTFSFSLFICLLFSHLTSDASATDNSQAQALEKCHREAQLFFLNHGPISSDRRREIRGKGEYVEAGTPIKNQFNETVAQFDWDVLRYRGVGSEHSGWFEMAVIVNPNDCLIHGQFYIYSE